MVQVDYRTDRAVPPMCVGGDRKLRTFVGGRVRLSTLVAKTHGVPAMHGLETRMLLKHYLEMGVSKAELLRRFCMSANARGPGVMGAIHDIW